MSEKVRSEGPTLTSTDEHGGPDTGTAWARTSTEAQARAQSRTDMGMGCTEGQEQHGSAGVDTRTGTDGTGGV